MDDRYLLDQAMKKYTEQGWEITSQSDFGFQVKAPHTVSAGAAAVFVALPVVGGVFVAFVSPIWGAVLFGFALACAAILAINHLTQLPKFLYISAASLR